MSEFELLRLPLLLFAILVLGGWRKNLSLKFGQAETSVLRAAASLLRQGLVWQNLKAQRRQTSRLELQGDFVRVLLWVFTLSQHGFVIKRAEGRAVRLRGDYLQRLAGGPAFAQFLVPVGHPGRLRFVQFRHRGVEFGLAVGEEFLQRCLSLDLLRGGNAQERVRVRFVPIHHRLVEVVEEGVKPVVLAVLNGIVFVRVTAGAGHRQSEPDRARGLGAVEGVLALIFLDDGAALAGAHVGADVAGANLLFRRRFGQQIARELLDGELIVRLIGVEGVHHPVAPFPEAAFGIDVEAVRIGVARGVEPVTRQMFTVTRRGEQTIHHLLVGIGILVGEIGVHLRHRRRNTGEVQRDAADERGLVGFNGRFQSLLLQPREDETIHLISGPLPILYRWKFRALRFGEGPVSLILRAFLDPAAEQRGLMRRDFLPGLGRRHQLVGIVAQDAFEQFALRDLPRDDGEVAGLRRLDRILRSVEAQLPFPFLVVGSVAGEAFVGENWLDVPVEVDAGGQGGSLVRFGSRGGKRRQRQAPRSGGEHGQPRGTFARSQKPMFHHEIKDAREFGTAGFMGNRLALKKFASKHFQAAD